MSCQYYFSPELNHRISGQQKFPKLDVQVLDDVGLILEPGVRLLHLGGVLADFVPQLGDGLQHALARQGRGLACFRKLGVKLQKLPGNVEMMKSDGDLAGWSRIT